MHLMLIKVLWNRFTEQRFEYTITKSSEKNMASHNNLHMSFHLHLQFI